MAQRRAIMVILITFIISEYFISVQGCNCILNYKCDCIGDAYKNMTNIPVKYLTITNSNMSTFSRDLIKVKSESLTDFHLTNMKHLKRIKQWAFQNFSNIRTIVIMDAPLLTCLPANFLREISTLKILKIIRTGLNILPILPMTTDSSIIMDTIDFEGNRITLLPANSIQVKVEHLFLGYNNLKIIEDWAFNGSQISKLSLQGNTYLNNLAQGAFSGIQDLQEIDLSNTSITYLPTLGLESIETLRIKNTFTLKTIPSIYDFKKLETADLTYSFHCCAFQYPEKHNPEKHALYQDLIKKMNDKCIQIQQVPHNLTRRDLVETTEFSSMGNEDEEMPTSDFPGDDYSQVEVVVPKHRLEIKCGNIKYQKRKVLCTPEPDALNPCEDIMGFEWLRFSVWFVIGAAFLGNIAVLMVTLSRTSEKSVPRYLISHLSFADLCMAFYLMLLAIKDIQSTEYYFNYAYDWQKDVAYVKKGHISTK